jgi:hypothetical protein
MIENTQDCLIQSSLSDDVVEEKVEPKEESWGFLDVINAWLDHNNNMSGM